MWDAIHGGIIMGKVVTNIYDEISFEAYDYYYNIGGENLANHWYQKVHNGDITKDELDKRVEKYKRRPDIEPEDWRDFEDGWRPEGWY